MNTTVVFHIRTRNAVKHTPVKAKASICDVTVSFRDDTFFAWCGAEWSKEEWDSPESAQDRAYELKAEISGFETLFRNEFPECIITKDITTQE